jgi:hypothetical protein
VLPAASVGQEEAEKEVVLGMRVDGVEIEHGTLGAAEYPLWVPRESYPSSRWLVNENRCSYSHAMQRSPVIIKSRNVRPIRIVTARVQPSPGSLPL